MIMEEFTIDSNDKIIAELKRVFTCDGKGGPAKAKILLDLFEKNGMVPVYEMIEEISKKKTFL